MPDKDREDEILEETIKGGPGYPDEVEQAWDDQDPMEGEAPTA